MWSIFDVRENVYFVRNERFKMKYCFICLLGHPIHCSLSKLQKSFAGMEVQMKKKSLLVHSLYLHTKKLQHKSARWRRRLDTINLLIIKIWQFPTRLKEYHKLWKVWQCLDNRLASTVHIPPYFWYKWMITRVLFLVPNTCFRLGWVK